ncbi:MAG: hypothetical protein WCD81_12325 [Candidatus Bathyarchaeia archaeon]
MKTVATITIGILLVAVGVLAGFLAAPIFQSNTSTYTGPEYLIISNMDGVVGPDEWIAVTVNNTGIAASTIAKVLVNNVTQMSVNPSLPLTVAEDGGVVLNITMNVAEESYQIELLTSRGNSFSISTQVTSGVILTPANVNFYGTANDKIDIDIENTGTSDAHLIQVYVGTSSSTLQNETSSSLPVTCAAGHVVRITVDYNWTSGGTYYFKVIAQEQILGPWAEQAPVTYDFIGTTSITITDVSFTGNSGQGNNTIVLTLKNTGTEQVTVGQIKVNNIIASFDTTNATLLSGANNVLLTVYNVGWSNGNPYKIDLFDASGNGVGSTQQNAPGA